MTEEDYKWENFRLKDSVEFWKSKALSATSSIAAISAENLALLNEVNRLRDWGDIRRQADAMKKSIGENA